MIQEFISIRISYIQWSKELENFLFYADFCKSSPAIERRKLQLFDEGKDSFDAGEIILKEFNP